MTQKKTELTQAEVKEYFDYRDGKLYWKITKRGLRKGTLAGCASIQDGRTRYVIKINYVLYLASRIIFLWHHGFLPAEVDHMNINPSDNRIENLRAATRSQNGMNRNSNKIATSQYLGVCFEGRSKRWRATIVLNKIQKGLGSFKTQEEAALAYNKAAVRYFGEFANPNIIKPKITEHT